MRTSDEILKDIVGAYNYNKEKGGDMEIFGTVVYIILAVSKKILVGAE